MESHIHQFLGIQMYWKPPTWAESPHLNICLCSGGHSWHQTTSCAGFAPGNFHFHAACSFDCLDFIDGFFFFYFPAGNSVHWCLSRLICTAWGSPATCLILHAVALEPSILFASCQTQLAGNLSKSAFPTLVVLDTNSSSHRKIQKISLCKILAVSGEVFG